MPTESEYGDDIKLLDDLTRLKLRLLDRKLLPSGRFHHRRARSPEYPQTPPPPPPERRRERFHRKIDRRNELLQKLWEELGNGGSYNRRYLPPLSPRPFTRHEAPPVAPWVEDQLSWNKTGHTKKDLMELMLIQNAQMQQWLMTQTLQRRQLGGSDNDGLVHHHYYDGAGRALPPIKRSDAGNQYPQDFFHDQGVGTAEPSRDRSRGDSREDVRSPPKTKSKKKRR